MLNENEYILNTTFDEVMSYELAGDGQVGQIFNIEGARG